MCEAGRQGEQELSCPGPLCSGCLLNASQSCPRTLASLPGLGMRRSGLSKGQHRGLGAGGSQATTHHVQVECAGAHEGDGAVQAVVVHTILVVLVGDHSEGEGPHTARAPVGQPHLQAYGVTHPAGRRLAVTRLSVHQHVCKGHRTRGCHGHC